MRDGSTRRRATSPRPTNWSHKFLQLDNWRRDHRFEDLCGLANSAHGLEWSRGLLYALLEELHVSDDFDVLVGRVARLPTSQYPRLVAVALLLRHSWSPEDLERTATRLGLQPGTSKSTDTTPRARRPQGRARTEGRTTC
jgi:hypothetical protein